MFGVAAPRESDVAVAGRHQGVRSSSDSPLAGDVVRGFCQTRWAALHSGEQAIACGRNSVSEAEAQAALNEVEAIINNVKFL
jgi:hypothetical protein